VGGAHHPPFVDDIFSPSKRLAALLASEACWVVLLLAHNHILTANQLAAGRAVHPRLGEPVLLAEEVSIGTHVKGPNNGILAHAAAKAGRVVLLAQCLSHLATTTKAAAVEKEQKKERNITKKGRSLTESEMKCPQATQVNSL